MLQPFLQLFLLGLQPEHVLVQIGHAGGQLLAPDEKSLLAPGHLLLFGGLGGQPLLQLLCMYGDPGDLLPQGGDLLPARLDDSLGIPVPDFQVPVLGRQLSHLRADAVHIFLKEVQLLLQLRGLHLDLRQLCGAGFAGTLGLLQGGGFFLHRLAGEGVFLLQGGGFLLQGRLAAGDFPDLLVKLSPLPLQIHVGTGDLRFLLLQLGQVHAQGVLFQVQLLDGASDRFQLLLLLLENPLLDV